MTDLASQREPPAPNATALGPVQRAWLERELRETTAPLIVWVVTFPWINARKKWGWYPRERAELGQLLWELAPSRRVVILSGDAHMLGAWGTTSQLGSL